VRNSYHASALFQRTQWYFRFRTAASLGTLGINQTDGHHQEVTAQLLPPARNSTVSAGAAPPKVSLE